MTNTNTKRIAKLGATLGDGLALVGTVALIGAMWVGLVALAKVNASEPLPACATEDSSDCVWDASTRGNGLGQSFITINDVTYLVFELVSVDAQGNAWVLDHDMTLDDCWRAQRATQGEQYCEAAR